MNPAKLIVHTDVLLDHLQGDDHPSILRMAMEEFFCYTTVFQAVELFAAMRTPAARRAAEGAMAAMKILGLNPRRAPMYGTLFAAHPRKRGTDLLVAGMCLDSDLPLLTAREGDFRGIRGLNIVAPRTLAAARRHTGRRNGG